MKQTGLNDANDLCNLNVINWRNHQDDLLVAFLFLSGFSGLTAYGGLFGICKLKKGDKVFVSAASGSVGNLVGQYAKLFGCYVVGSAGSQKKVSLTSPF